MVGRLPVETTAQQSIDKVFPSEMKLKSEWLRFGHPPTELKLTELLGLKGNPGPTIPAHELLSSW
jgi:hypothetical protein